MKKKKIVFQSDFSLGKTGFGRNAKALLKYLYALDKYEIIHYCCGTPYSEPFLQKTPWKSIGCLPDNPQEREMLNKDPYHSKRASYGEYYLDKVIKEEKPDVYIAVQDIWGVDFAIQKPWFNKINSIIWTTLDSLPILPTAIAAAKKVEHYWIWSDFATRAMREVGHDHVRTVHGVVEPDCFHKLSDSKRKELRDAQGIDQDDFIIGFVFRNQLRKSVPNLLEGFKKFKDKNPKSNGKLLLHTHFGEGWGILKLAKEYKIEEEDILTTYACKSCHRYSITPFRGQDTDCPLCGAEKSMVTTQVAFGVTEEQLNEIYNLMDVYCHPFTSGGQEIPIQEAKLAELITLVTSYSCGEEMCCDEAYSLPLDWSEYREHGTEFIKASTSPDSIAKQLNKAFKMDPKKRLQWGKKAREWVANNFAPDVVGKFIQEYIDDLPTKDYDFKFEDGKQNPNYLVPKIEDDAKWVLHLYEHILGREGVDEEDDGFKYWMEQMDNGTERGGIERYFKKIAQAEIDKNNKIPLEDLLDKDDENRRIIYVMPESIGDIFLSTSLFKSIKETYPDYNLYVAVKPQFYSVVQGNEYVHKVVPYVPQMENFTFLEGQSENAGFFEVAFTPYVNTQRQMCYTHNGKDKIAYDKTCLTY